MKNIPVEDGIPVPHSNERNIKWPFDTMEVGQSFAIEATEVHNARAACSVYQRRHNYNKKFTIRIYGDGYRCWRTE